MGQKAKNRNGLIIFSIIFAILIGLAALANMMLIEHDNKRPLAPNSTTKTGAEALATILKTHGVQVIHTTQEKQLKKITAEATVLVTNPDELSTDEITLILKSKAEIIVIVNNDTIDLYDWEIYNQLVEIPTPNKIAAQCDEQGAQSAKYITPAKVFFDLEDGDTGCFLKNKYPTWLTPADNPKLHFFGAGETFMNQNLTKAGNAAFALHQLGKHKQLFWIEQYRGKDAYTNPETPRIDGMLWLYFLFVALMLSGLWYSVVVWRRFGKLVAEPLPVIVPAGETDLGRAKLYSRSNDYTHLATILRAEFISKFANKIGIRANSSKTEIIGAITQISRKSETEIANLLYDQAINNKKELYILEQELKNIEKDISYDPR